MNCGPDYALIYRLEDEREAKARAYVCPFWDRLKAIAQDWDEMGIWDIWEPDPGERGHRGEVSPPISSVDRLIHIRFCDECSGEIPWR